MYPAQAEEAARIGPVTVQGLDLEAAWSAHSAGVRRFLRRVGLSAAEAEDVTAEAFLVAHQKRHQFDPARPVRPWLLGIAARIAQRHQRRAWFRRLLSRRVEQEPELEGARDPLRALVDAEDAARVRKALEALPERKRTLLVLREYEELSAEEIGQALGMPEATVYSALHYARKELVKQYRRLMLMEAMR